MGDTFADISRRCLKCVVHHDAWVVWGKGWLELAEVGLPTLTLLDLTYLTDCTVREVIRSSYVDVRDVQGRRGLAVDIAA